MVTLEQVQDAAARIAASVHRTPCLRCGTVDRLGRHRVVLKAENFQKGGSFKVRGATNAVLSLEAGLRQRGVVAYSSGNHAQGVALAARAAGCRATVVMPEDAPASKRAAVEAYGATVIAYDRQTDSREEIAGRLARETGCALVPPFDDERIIAGQATATLELLEECPDLDALLVPVGGGGLLAGACVSAAALRPSLRVFGVEPVGADSARRSLLAGAPVRLEQQETVCDGLRPPAVGELTFAHFAPVVEEVLLVSDEEVVTALRLLLLRAKILVEPSGAAALAALLAGRVPVPPGSRVGVLLSGGNVDPSRLAALLRPDANQGTGDHHRRSDPANTRLERNP